MHAWALMRRPKSFLYMPISVMIGRFRNLTMPGVLN